MHQCKHSPRCLTQRAHSVSSDSTATSRMVVIASSLTARPVSKQCAVGGGGGHAILLGSRADGHDRTYLDPYEHSKPGLPRSRDLPGAAAAGLSAGRHRRHLPWPSCVVGRPARAARLLRPLCWGARQPDRARTCGASAPATSQAPGGPHPPFGRRWDCSCSVRAHGGCPRTPHSGHPSTQSASSRSRRRCRLPPWLWPSGSRIASGPLRPGGMTPVAALVSPLASASAWAWGPAANAWASAWAPASQRWPRRVPRTARIDGELPVANGQPASWEGS